jgi:hypothetical protein
MTGVVLGLPGDYLTEGAGSHYVTKVGGVPDLPGDAMPTTANGITCRTCGGPMSLVLQVCCSKNHPWLWGHKKLLMGANKVPTCIRRSKRLC